MSARPGGESDRQWVRDRRSPGAGTLDGTSGGILDLVPTAHGPAEAERENRGPVPYPFFLASPLQQANLSETPPGWWVEPKWDGIRGQLIQRESGTYLWSRGEELINDQFPELVAMAAALPHDTVLDGEVICWAETEAEPRPFSDLQRRLGRKTVGRKLRHDCPVSFVAYDVLEHNAQDLRPQPLQQRLATLVDLYAGFANCEEGWRCRLSHGALLNDWTELDQQRQTAVKQGAEGVMLKHHQSPYLSGRKRGHWWKHKRDPMTLDAVLIYAQAGRGRRPTCSPITPLRSGMTNPKAMLNPAGDICQGLLRPQRCRNIGTRPLDQAPHPRTVRSNALGRSELVLRLALKASRSPNATSVDSLFASPESCAGDGIAAPAVPTPLPKLGSCASASRTGQHERLEPLRARKNRVNPFQGKTISPSKKLIDSADQKGESKTREIIFSTPDTLQSLDISLRKPSIDWTIDWVVVRHDGVVPGPPRVITKIFQAKRMADFVNQRAFLRIGK